MIRFFTFILSILYFTTASGATVYVHYCMGKIVEWNMAGSDSEQCPNCGMEKDKKGAKDCCKDEHKQLKGISDHSIAESAFYGFQLTSLAVPVSYFEASTIALSSIAEENPTGNAPPESSHIPLYKRNRVFRI